MATIFMVSQMNRSIFKKILKLDRLSKVSTQKYLVLTPKCTQCVLFSTNNRYFSRERFPFSPPKIYEERTDWPSADIWKRINFSDRDRFYPQKASFQEMCDSLKGASYSPTQFYYLMALKDPTVPWTESLACDVLMLLMNCKIGFTSQERLKWIHYIKDQVKKNGPVTTPVQNNILICYLNLNYDFDPVDILNELEEAGQEPKQEILAKLMRRYVYLRDFPAARSIFDHIKEELTPSPDCLSVMLMGYTMAGFIWAKIQGIMWPVRIYHLGEDDPMHIYVYAKSDNAVRRHEAAALEENLKSKTQNAPWRFLSTPIMMGYMLGGDFENAHKVGSSLDDQGKIFYLFRMIENCSFLKLDKGIDVLIDLVRRRGEETFYNICTPPLCALILNGYHEKAFELFSLLKDPGAHIFLKSAVRGEMPPDLAFKYTTRMEEQGIRNASMYEYLASILLHKDKYALLKDCLTFFRQKGLVLRPQDLWQQICHIRDGGTLEDLKGILPLYMLDETTEDVILFPCLLCFDVKVEDISPLFQENSNLNKDEIKYIKFQYAMYLRQKEIALEVIDSGFEMKNVGIDRITKGHFKADLKWRFSEDSRVEKFLDEMEGGTRTLKLQCSQMLKKENANRQEVLQLATKLMQNKLFREGSSLLFYANLEPFESSRGTPDKCTFFDHSAQNDKARHNMSMLIRSQFLNTGSDDVDTRMWQIKFVKGIIHNYLENIKERDDPNSYVQLLLLFLKDEDNLALAIYNMVFFLIKIQKLAVLNEVLSLPSLSKNYADTSAVSLALVFLEQGQTQKASAALQKCTIPYMTYLRFINLLAAEEKIDVLHGLYSIASAQITDLEQIKDMLSIIQMYTAKSRGEKASQEFYDKYSEDLHLLQQESL